MVETKLVLVALVASVLSGCCSVPWQRNGDVRVSWTKVVMDGNRTGVTAVAGSNVSKALGDIDSSGAYHAPNGSIFDCGSVPAVAMALLEAQPSMAYLKEIIGYSTEEMSRSRIPQSALASWAVDALMLCTERKTGRKVDIGLINFGGIRRDMPQGPVLLDDIVSMFPFKNYLCWLQITGSDLRYMLEDMVKNDNIQAFGGITMLVEDGVIKDVKVGGKPLENKAIYGLATVDFLLDGGDHIYAARNARQLIITDVKVSDCLVAYIRELTAEGRNVGFEDDGRIKFVDSEEVMK